MPSGNEPFQGSHVAKQLLPSLQEEKKLVCQILKPDNPRVHQEDPLSDGVFQYPKILSRAGIPKV